MSLIYKSAAKCDTYSLVSPFQLNPTPFIVIQLGLVFIVTNLQIKIIPAWVDSHSLFRVSLDNGGYLVIEQTEALVSIDVNGGHCMLGQGTSQEKAILEVNLAAAKQVLSD